MKRLTTGTDPRFSITLIQEWKLLFDHVHREWMESVQLVFDYFCERTPRSFVEARETSLVWNYKYAGEIETEPLGVFWGLGQCTCQAPAGGL